MRICHLITSLNPGGAQSMLRRLIAGLEPMGFKNKVICFVKYPVIADSLKEIGVEVIDLGLSSTQISAKAFIQAKDIVNEFKPDVGQGLMYHGNTLGSLLPTNAKIFWNIRHSLEGFKQEKKLTQLLIRSAPLLSQRASKIIYCSELSTTRHEAFGFPPEKRVVIPNGFSANNYYFDREARISLRNKLKISEDVVVLGNATRFHPMKNQLGLIKAFAEIKKDFPQILLLLCGRGIDWNNPQLADLIDTEQIEDSVRLLSHVDDMRSLYSALDLYVSASSWGEAFPNVLGEAMLCQLPCITTDVGDSRLLVGNSGVIIPPSTQDKLVQALTKMLNFSLQERQEYGLLARKQIITKYEINKIINDYAKAYKSVAG